MPADERYGSADVELIDNEEAYKGFFQIRGLTLKHRLFAGGMSESIHRELFTRHDAVGVLLFDPKLDSVCLVEQFRVGAFGHDIVNDVEQPKSPWILELVAGLIDKGEPPEVVGIRESAEEAGAVVESLEPIAEYFSSPGGSTEYFYLYCGKADLADVEGVYGLDEESEDIRAHLIPTESAFDMVDRGDISNAHTLIALQWLMRHRERLLERWLP